MTASLLPMKFLYDGCGHCNCGNEKPCEHIEPAEDESHYPVCGMDGFVLRAQSFTINLS